MCFDNDKFITQYCLNVPVNLTTASGSIHDSNLSNYFTHYWLCSLVRYKHARVPLGSWSSSTSGSPSCRPFPLPILTLPFFPFRRTVQQIFRSQCIEIFGTEACWFPTKLTKILKVVCLLLRRKHNTYKYTILKYFMAKGHFFNQ